ncbi:MAG TPA: BON domain-containing protein [Longimicrobiaceae bacterium]
MRLFHEPEPDYGRDALTFALGAAGGLALGLLLVRSLPTPQRSGDIGRGLRERARAVAGRFRPARLRRRGPEQRELAALEDRVLEAFFADPVLSERGIDVGAISPGIVELSGSVWTEEEAEAAVRLASRVSGVRTVVNRMDVEEEEERRRRRVEDDSQTSIQHGIARVGGMGVRRQGLETEPARPDESRDIALNALNRADREQREDEDLTSSATGEGDQPWRQRFAEDEVAPQDPHGKHAPVTLDAPQQALNSSSRVGEAPKPGEHLALEQADVPAKPHGRNSVSEGNEPAE